MRSVSPRGRSLGIDAARPASERYRVLGRIAAGGMAEIYLARLAARGARHEVALKRLLPELQSNHELVQMFFDEARIASLLQHPNIAEIYELGELEGSLFIAMELVRGVNLKEIYERASALGRGLPLSVVLRIALGALEALEHAHTAVGEDGAPLNVVHRDVSPQNILVTYQGEVKLVDFGVARAERRLHATRQGLVKGKFAYMAPEQIHGEPVDGRADLFALAEVIYLLALHRHPFYAETDAGVLQAVLEAKPPAPTTLDPRFPAGLSNILVRALQRRPEARWPDAKAMREAIEAFLGDRLRAVSAEALSRWVRDAFADRLALEEEARRAGDDDLLVDAMRAPSRVRPPVARPRAPVPTAPAKVQPKTRLFRDPAAGRDDDGPPRSEPPRAEPPRLEPGRAEPPRLEPGRLDPGRLEPSHADAAATTAPLPEAAEGTSTMPVPPVDLSMLPPGRAPIESTLSVAEARAYEEPELDRAALARSKPRTRPDDVDALTVRGDDDGLEAQLAALPGFVGPEVTALAAPEPPALGAPPAEEPRPRRAEEIIGRRLGRYVLKKRLGSGGLGEVYLATVSEGLERRVALKRFHPRLVADHDEAAALAEAVRSASRLAHPNVATVWDLGFEDDELYAVVEYVHGWDLGAILERCRKRGVFLPVAVACRLVASALAALDAAHGLAEIEGTPGPLLHGDLTPENILVSMQGGVKVTDFGLATAGASSAVSTETFRGKARYAAPERFSREAGVVDVRSDVFSAGVVLYEALVLRPMFARPTVFETMMAVAREPFPRMTTLRPDVPGVLDRLLEQAVARPQGERLPSAHAFLLELERFLARLAEPMTPSAVGTWLRALFAAEAEDQPEIFTDAALVAGDFTGDERTRAAPAPIPLASPSASPRPPPGGPRSGPAGK